jgi:hypothetical protein
VGRFFSSTKVSMLPATAACKRQGSGSRETQNEQLGESGVRSNPLKRMGRRFHSARAQLASTLLGSEVSKGQLWTKSEVQND